MAAVIEIFIGLCQISQANMSGAGDRLYLTEIGSRAAMIPLNVGGRFVWKITISEQAPSVMLTLMPGGSTNPPLPELALTLGPQMDRTQEMIIDVKPATSEQHILQLCGS